MKMQYHSQKIVLKHATHEALNAKSPNLGWKQYKPFYFFQIKVEIV